MNTSEVLNMIQVLKDTGYRHIDVVHEGSHIILSNAEMLSQTAQSSGMPMSSAPTSTVATPAMPQTPQSVKVESLDSAINVVEDAQASEPIQGGHLVESPIVGTYYNAPSPEADPYVCVGSKVKKGDVLCIIEAMKLMNEIEADQEGEIVEILVENEQGVEYGQPLFRIV